MTDIREHVEKLRPLAFQIGAYRPPSEGGNASLLLQVTENCPWNRCSFCEMYRGQRFGLRRVDDVKADIDRIAAIRDEIAAVSRTLEMGGRITRELVAALVTAAPDLADNPCFVTVFNWIAGGGRSAFLQDADSMSMRPTNLAEVLRHLRDVLPTLSRVTTYARAKTLARRTVEDLVVIRQAGLDRLHIGLETGDDELLAKIGKGVTSAEQIESGRKASAAGFEVSEYWMPDLGGREHWRQHAQNTARVLSAINPHYIRSRPLAPRRGTPLYDELNMGRLTLSSPRERLEELAMMVSSLEVTSKLCFDHAMNNWVDRSGRLLFRQDYEGYQFPAEKALVLERISEGLEVPESWHGHVRQAMAAPSL